MVLQASPELQQLHKFVGKWNTSGRIPARGSEPEQLIRGTDSYEWLPGGFFLLHQVNVFVGSEKNETVEIIGYDTQSGKYSMQHYDNKGNSGRMWAWVDDGIWTFEGEGLRFSGGFKNQDNEFSGIWEQKKDDGGWEHLMDIKLLKSA